MVCEEAGVPVPGYFGIGNSLALNGQVYYWKGVDDKVISEVPSCNFVALCTKRDGCWKVLPSRHREASDQ